MSFALALMALQFAVIRTATSDVPVRIVLPLTIALAPLALWPLRRYGGVWVMFVGFGANLAAILANGGLMPIEQSTVIAAIGEQEAANYELGAWIEGSKDVLVGPGDGRLVALGDGIIVRLGSGGIAASPGDFVIWIGVLVLAAEAAIAWNRAARERGPATAPTPARSRAQGSATTPQ
jgi:hypothetical protein